MYIILPYSRIRDNQGQEAFIAPSTDKHIYCGFRHKQCASD